jgi:Mycobacterial cell wall arabinan synthesis protein
MKSPSWPGVTLLSKEGKKLGGRGWRERLPLALALVALALAVFAAITPSIPKRATYVWPPTHVSGQPERSWFAPLLAERGTADAISATVPCRPGPVLRGAGASPVLLATARGVRSYGALQARWLGSEQRLVVRVGSKTLAQIKAPPGVACTVGIRIDGRQWSIRQSTGEHTSGELPTEVGVTGLITQLDLRAKPRLQVEVTPTTEDTRTSTAQTILRVLALIALVAALAVVIGHRSVRPQRPKLRNVLGSFGLPDTFVGLALLTWWIVGPVYDDDGWVTARQTSSIQSGGFSNYYDHHAANLPLGWWLEWLQRLVVGHTKTLLWQRVPSIVCLGVLWIVVRATLTALSRPSRRRGNPTWWSAATTFILGAAALGVTLRPEPMNALLVAGVLLCMVSFLRRPSPAPLALAVTLAGLAVTEHPEGLLALAPILACLPRIVGEVRSREIPATNAAAIGVAGLAWAAVLEFLGSDLRHRLTDAHLESTGYNSHWFDEWSRYVALYEDGSPLRRAFAALCILGALASLTGVLRVARNAERLPGASLALGLVLLIFVPSKWVWHFGALMGPCAVAAGVEVDRWHKAALSARWRSSTHAGFVAGGLLVAIGLALRVSPYWGLLVLRTVTLRHGPLFQIGTVVVAWGVVKLLVTAVERIRHGPWYQTGPSWRSLSIAFPVTLSALVALTTAVFVADAIATPEPTSTRQNVDALLGRASCGLAGDIVVPDVSTISATPRLGVGAATAVSAGAASSARGSDLQILRAGRSSVSESSSWYRLPPQGRALGLYAGGTWQQSDSLRLTWGRVETGRVVAIAAMKVYLSKVAYRGPDGAAWSFVPQSSLPAPPAGAAVVRVSIDSAGASRAVATSPVWYSTIRLDTWMTRPRAVARVSPFLLEYMPCARIPVLKFGVLQRPRILVDSAGPPSATFSSGPGAGIPDVFEVTRLPVLGPPDLRSTIAVYDVSVDQRDAIAPAKPRGSSA